MSSVEHDDMPQALQGALGEILEAVARICLQHGVSLEVVTELTKRAMVRVAHREFTIPGRKQSASRIAVLTGMHRKDVARALASSPPDGPDSRERIAYVARVIAGWRRDKRFKDRRGRTASLGLDAPSPSFMDLVKRYGGRDIPGRAVLDELERIGAVSRLRNGRIRLVTSAYVPAGASKESVAIFGEDVADLIQTIGQNMASGPEGGIFQRRVAYDNLPVEAIERIHRQVRKEGQALLESLDGLMAKSDRDSNPASRGSGRRRAKVGVYFHAADVDPERESKSPDYLGDELQSWRRRRSRPECAVGGRGRTRGGGSRVPHIRLRRMTA